MARRKLVIGLLWHSVNSHNLGIGALTIANIAMIRRIAAAGAIDVSFVVIGWQDDRPPYVTDTDVTMAPFRPRDHLRRPDRLIALIRRCDIVFDIGAGDSFSDLYGAKRFLYLAATKALVLALGRPLVLSPQTIGPYRRRWARALAARIMRRADAVVARDRLSLDVLHEMGVTRNCCEATDVAFKLPAEGPAPPPTGKTRIGLNISGLLFNGGATAARRLGLKTDYAALTRRMLGHFTAMEDCEVHLIGHVFAGQGDDDDRRAIARVAAEFPRAVAAPEFASPAHAKAWIGAMDFFAGARMHACIAAFSSGVPVIPVAYSRKFAGLFGSLGYHWSADCTQETTDAVLARVAQGFAQRGRLRRDIAGCMESALAMLAAYEGVIAARLGAVAAARPPAEALQPA